MQINYAETHHQLYKSVISGTYLSNHPASKYGKIAKKLDKITVVSAILSSFVAVDGVALGEMLRQML